MRSRYRRQMPGLASVLLLVAVWTAPCAAQQAPPATTGTISGRVVDSLGQPVIGASVVVNGSGQTTQTDSTGAFRLRDVPPGSHTIAVRRLRFLADTEIFMLAKGSAAFRTITVTHAAVQLPAVKTVKVGEFGKPARLAYTMKYDGFYERRFYATGSGKFFTHEELEAMKTTDLVDMLRRIPFLKINGRGDSGTIQFPDCGEYGIQIVIDGQQVWPLGQGAAAQVGTLSAAVGQQPKPGSFDEPGPLSMLETLRINQVEAIESYPTVVSMPASMVGNGCAAILIWTR